MEGRTSYLLKGAEGDKIEDARRANKDLENGHNAPTVQPLPRNRRPQE